jgi:cytoskeletal protein CcmA (bactofilin family)
MSDDQRPATEQGPAPEVLTVQGGDAQAETEVETRKGGDLASQTSPTTAKRRNAYRPSHKATFIGLAVVVGILAINAGVLVWMSRGQSEAEQTAAKNGVTISASTLEQLGVSRNPIGNAETELTVGPNSTFNGKVVMGGDLTVAGQLTLNSKFTATSASLSSLQAGQTQLESLNVNGDQTVTNLNIRKDLQVAGTTRLQGALTVNQLTTINNNMNVAGNLSVGGSLSVRNFQVGTLTIAGHLLTSGSQPGVSAGGGVGSNGTVSISGNDTAGTVAVNTGVGAGNGLLASIVFATKYSTTPHVVVTPIGRSMPGMYINRTSAGFTISVDGTLSTGGFAFDYLVMQ